MQGQPDQSCRTVSRIRKDRAAACCRNNGYNLAESDLANAGQIPHAGAEDRSITQGPGCRRNTGSGLTEPDLAYAGSIDCAGTIVSHCISHLQRRPRSGTTSIAHPRGTSDRSCRGNQFNRQVPLWSTEIRTCAVTKSSIASGYTANISLLLISCGPPT